MVCKVGFFESEVGNWFCGNGILGCYFSCEDDFFFGCFCFQYYVVFVCEKQCVIGLDGVCVDGFLCFVGVQFGEFCWNVYYVVFGC